MARHYTNPRFPSTPEQVAQALHDPVRAAELYGGDKSQWQAFERAYAESSPLLDTMVEERAQLLVQSELQAGGRKPPQGITGPPTRHDTTGPGRRGRRHPYNRRAAGAKLDALLPESEFPLSQFVAAMNPKNEHYQPLRTQLANASMGERVPAEGGALVPEVLRSDILMLVLEQSVIRPRCHVVEMDSLRVPYPALDDVTHANATSVYGGISGYWTEEGAALTASAPAFGRIVLQARKLTSYTTIPNELIADAGPMLEDWLRTAWPAALAWYFDDAAINGDGVGEPQGFLNAPAAIKVTTTASNTITMADLIKAYVRFLPQALPGAVWLASPDVKLQLMNLALTAQSAVRRMCSLSRRHHGSRMARRSTEFRLPFSGIRFSGRKRCRRAPARTRPRRAPCRCATSITCCSASVSSSSSRQARSTCLSASDMTAYRMIERCDARVWPQSALSPRNGGSSLSPFVLIDTTS